MYLSESSRPYWQSIGYVTLASSLCNAVGYSRHNLSCFANFVLFLWQYRLTSYRHFLEWILQGERLGRGNRLVLPACVVQAIRANYPTQDGQYRGYQETVDAQDELWYLANSPYVLFLYIVYILWIKLQIHVGCCDLFTIPNDVTLK